MTERCDLRLPTYCVARAPGELGGMMHRWIARATGWPLAAKPPAVAAASSSTPILIGLIVAAVLVAGALLLLRRRQDVRPAG